MDRLCEVTNKRPIDGLSCLEKNQIIITGSFYLQNMGTRPLYHPLIPCVLYIAIKQSIGPLNGLLAIGLVFKGPFVFGIELFTAPASMR
jgi:hypothetical protein